MKRALQIILLIGIGMAAWFSPSVAQDKKLERIRIGGGAVGAPQMTMWFAKEANLYEKHGLGVEAIHIPGSSLALQAMLSGEVPIIQLGGTASMQANWPAPIPSSSRRFSRNFCSLSLAGRISPG
jgi:ABC-type nitrate/sulfonate/bicarbonate transport system substrate-binding protein